MFQTLPGFREFYPEDCAIRNYIFGQWRQSALRFAFQEFDGPLLEPLELITAKSGDEIVSQLFNFEDKGGRAVTLRPELTPTLARLVGAKAGSIKRPVKWFGIAENFRYEKPQKGRLRSHYQFNADILGESSPAADAEIIALLITALCSFGLSEKEFVLRLSDRDLWLLLLEQHGLTGDIATGALNVIDKMERESPESLLKMMGEKHVPGAEAVLADASKLVECTSLEAVESFFAGRENNVVTGERVSSRLDQWRELLGHLHAMGLGGFIRVDLGIVRGLAYYTGFVFEAFQTVGKGRALAGGGRYDHLVEKLGFQAMPAVGFGMGDVTLRDLLEDQKLLPDPKPELDGYVVVAGGENEARAALRDVAALRAKGLKIDRPLKQQGFGKQFKTAGQSGARFALIYGEVEVAEGKLKLRDLVSGEESLLTADEAASRMLQG
ncbi:histidine--tRNA ligase [Ruficoccus amylovorans]|uniref:Histidine--tRNA ligase n=1 Tax=Ruficoccus amylovorans TaxID=1804625 RepID=A0A842HCU9_9BACT|nr:histidine--tRNA ligase [Ruficoccus amylovorans]MBC2594242.1 histidine--tRNA ligase [Ruficoccus amylovorans]